MYIRLICAGIFPFFLKILCNSKLYLSLLYIFLFLNHMPDLSSELPKTSILGFILAVGGVIGSEYP